jgi:molybdopterin-guanine dinucleotide biosynthesis protein
MAASIVVIGPCGTGKTTLVEALQAQGYAARVVAQEHSAVQHLWEHQETPTALIMLDATPAVISARRHNEFPQWLYEQQRQRLRSAEEHATLYLHTDELASEQVQQQVIEHLQYLDIAPEPGDQNQ